MGERVDEKRGRLSKRERERERQRERETDRRKDEESMRMGEGRKSSGKQMYRNCKPTMNVNTPWERKIEIKRGRKVRREREREVLRLSTNTYYEYILEFDVSFTKKYSKII